MPRPVAQTREIEAFRYLSSIHAPDNDKSSSVSQGCNQNKSSYSPSNVLLIGHDQHGGASQRFVVRHLV